MFLFRWISVGVVWIRTTSSLSWVPHGRRHSTRSRNLFGDGTRQNGKGKEAINYFNTMWIKTQHVLDLKCTKIDLFDEIFENETDSETQLALSFIWTGIDLWNLGFDCGGQQLQYEHHRRWLLEVNLLLLTVKTLVDLTNLFDTEFALMIFPWPSFLVVFGQTITNPNWLHLTWACIYPNSSKSKTSQRDIKTLATNSVCRRTNR